MEQLVVVVVSEWEGYPKVQCPDLLFLVLMDSMAKNVFQVLDLIRPKLIFDMRVLHTLNEIRSQNDTGTVGGLDVVCVLCHVTELVIYLCMGSSNCFSWVSLYFAIVVLPHSENLSWSCALMGNPLIYL